MSVSGINKYCNIGSSFLTIQSTALILTTTFCLHVICNFAKVIFTIVGRRFMHTLS